MRRQYRLRIVLRDVEPPVWRQLLVDPDMTLAQLAPVLEAAMGWSGYHLHAFEAQGRTYEIPEEADVGDSEERTVDERTSRLADVLPEADARMLWQYDFGDGWEHDVVLEGILESESGAPTVLDGERACPPEDCGGPSRYGHLLAVLADPTHPEHRAMSQWAPPNFDAERFDLDESHRAMQSLRHRSGMTTR